MSLDDSVHMAAVCINELLTVNYQGTTASTDWIGMYVAGSQVDAYGAAGNPWVYRCGTMTDSGALATGVLLVVLPLE
jgi:hypothetical protein